VSQQVVRQQHRLGVLQVGAPRHDGIQVRGGLRCNRIDEPQHLVPDHQGMIEQVEANERRDLVIATPPGAKFAPKFGAGNAHKLALERTMHILITVESNDRAILHARKERVEGGLHPVKFDRIKVPGFR
jgi:hypothetical protein